MDMRIPSLPSCITIFFHWIPLSAIPVLRVNRTYFQTSKVVHHLTADSLVASYIFVSCCFFPISWRCWGVAGAPVQHQIQLVCIYTWTSLKRHHGSRHACLNGRIWDDSRCPETMHGLGLRWHPRNPNLYSGGKLSCLIPFNFPCLIQQKSTPRKGLQYKFQHGITIYQSQAGS